MEWENRIVHSVCILYLAPQEAMTSYHLPTLPYLLIKQEILLMKKKYLPECPTNELDGYENIPIEDAQVEAIVENQPKWREDWLKKRSKDQSTLLPGTPIFAY